jgi:beta-glucosidase
VNSVPAILEAWYPGEEDGNAVAAVLFGPSGKLPLTFPKSTADLPANTTLQYPGVNNQENYSEGVFVGYRWYDSQQIAPLFPFGHGLSYTSFAYSNVTASAFTTADGEPVAVVDFDVTNTGKVAGAEVAQIYVGMPASAVPQPPKQLKSYVKVSLAPGRSVHVIDGLDARSFSYWDVTTHAWKVAPGTYQIMVGSSSRDIRSQTAITFPAAPVP